MFTIEEIALATGGEIIGSLSCRVTGVSTDSRTAGKEELFIPLRGQTFDGHDYIPAAAARGVRVFLAARKWLGENSVPEGAVAVAVTDTLRGLGDLAAFHRSRFSIPVVGVTGSNGKTTTKEMIAAILSLTGPGLKTRGNLNNLIGLPLMLLGLTGKERWAVVEMGMSEPGEIDRLAEIARPDVGVITNVFSAHLESLGTIAGVAKAKGELFMRLLPGSWAVYNADDRMVADCPVPEGVIRLGFGLENGEITADGIETFGLNGIGFTLSMPTGRLPVLLKAFGRHNIMNALAAASAVVALGIDAEAIRAGLESFAPFDKRFQVEELDGVVLVDDSYNANPASMEAALRTLKMLGGNTRAIGVLGDMLELGPAALEAHRNLGKLAAEHLDRLYLFGNMAEVTAEAAIESGLPSEVVVIADSSDKLISSLLGDITRDDHILVKGSRGMRMDLMADAIRRAFPVQRIKGAVD